MMEIVSAAAAAKLAGVALSTWGAYATWRTLPVPAIRVKVIKVFQIGQLGLKKKRGKKKEIMIYPTIRRVALTKEKAFVVFTLPAGLDPDKILKSEWIFKQLFGEHINLEAKISTCTLTVYPNPLQQFSYSFDDLKDAIKSKHLPIVIGKSRKGLIFYDMAEFPHLLIAGETGSGKSTALRSILATLILHGARFRLFCADLKRSEFHLFRGVADKVVVDARGLAGILREVKKELQRRGDMLDAAEVGNILDLEPAERPPFIVLAIDEVALLKNDANIMDTIDEIGAIGRALGVFLILSMQRPDAEVIDGRLKNNLTVRMAFRHSDEINSRITLGSGEAAAINIKERGRMYLKLDGLHEVQSPYLDMKEAKKLLAPYKREREEQQPTVVQPETVEQDDEDLIGVL